MKFTFPATFRQIKIRKESKERLILVFLWLLIITLLRWHWHWDLLGFWIGGILGIFFLDLDHLVYALAIYPQEATSLKAKGLLEAGRYREMIDLLRQTENERVRLPFHNAGFQVIFFIFSFFVLTSTGNLFGAGLVMAMALHLLQYEFGFLLEGKEKQLRDGLFWWLDREVSLSAQKTFVFTMLLLFLGLNLLLI